MEELGSSQHPETEKTMEELGSSQQPETEKTQEEKPMITTSHHEFGDPSQCHYLRLSISEVIQEEYGLYVWPCSLVLAEYIWQQRLRFLGSNVLELGAGTALPGLVAAKVGADVTLTDRCDRVEILNNMQRICQQNAVDCKIQGLTWGEWDSASLCLNPEIILGADTFYDSKDFDDLFATVSFFLRKNPSGVFITTYQSRSGHHVIEYLMAKWKLRCTKLLDALEVMPLTKLHAVTNSIELVEIMSKV